MNTPGTNGSTRTSRIDEPLDVDRSQVFCLEGEYWTIAYQGQVFRLRDTKGLHGLAHLLSRPGESVPATSLWVLVNGPQGGAAEAERARSAVTKRIKDAIAKIAVHHSGLGHHLRSCIRTGSRCTYLPDVTQATTWSVGAAPDESRR